MALKENVKAALIKRVEENSLLFWGKLDVELYFSAQHTVLISGIPHSLFNGVLRSQIPGNPSEYVEKILAEFRWRKLPFTWWMDAKLKTTGFGKLLEAHGLSFFEEFSGMALELNHNHISNPKDKDLTIDPVTGSNLMSDWKGMLDFYFDLDEQARSAYVDMFLNKVLTTKQPFRHFLARYNGTPVGGATLFIHGDVGGIYNLSVSPEFRDKGIATTLIEELVESTKMSGCRFVVVVAPQKTCSLFHSLGFQKVCYFEIYSWPAAKSNIQINPYTPSGGT